MKKQFYPGGLTAEEHLDRILGVNSSRQFDHDEIANEVANRDRADEIHKRKMAAKWSGEHIRTIEPK